MITRRLLVLAPAVAWSLPARAEAMDDAQKFIEALARDLLGVVNGAAGAAEKRTALERIVDRTVDIDAVARFCLGRFARTATPDQLKAYLAQFRVVLVRNITGKVGDYQGVAMTVGKALAREDDIIVTSTVTRPNNAPNKVDWVVTSSGGAPKIIDVVAEGTSLRLTQRSDYAAFLGRNNNNVGALIEAMKAQASQ